MMVHCVIVMDEYLKMVKKNIGIAHLSEDMIEDGIKVRDHSHEKKTDIKEKFAFTRCKLDLKPRPYGRARFTVGRKQTNAV